MKRFFVWLATAIAGSVVISKANAEHIDTVTVTAQLNRPQDQSPVPVTVVNGDELQQRAAGTIGATLDSSPGLTSASFGPGVGQPVIRGQNGPRVMTLINGTASADASGVSADHAVTVEPMAVGCTWSICTRMPTEVSLSASTPSRASTEASSHSAMTRGVARTGTLPDRNEIAVSASVTLISTEAVRPGLAGIVGTIWRPVGSEPTIRRMQT